MIKNNKGMALVFFLSLLPILLSAMGGVYTLITLHQADLSAKYLCRNGGIQGQKETAPHLHKLLALNSKSLNLKNQYLIAKAKLAAAIASHNPLAIGAATRRLQLVKTRRLALDSQQQVLLSLGQQTLRGAHHDTHQKLKDLKLVSPLLVFKIEPALKRVPSLAVRPRYSDIAPPYDLLPDFESAQALVHQWQYHISIKKPWSAFLNQNYSFTKACAVSLRKESDQWFPQIVKAKLSLKSQW